MDWCDCKPTLPLFNSQPYSLLSISISANSDILQRAVHLLCLLNTCFSEADSPVQLFKYVSHFSVSRFHLRNFRNILDCSPQFGFHLNTTNYFAFTFDLFRSTFRNEQSLTDADPLARTEFQKYLGVIIYTNLRRSLPTFDCVKRICRTLFQFRRSRLFDLLEHRSI